MATFKDHKGDDWSILITAGTLRRAKSSEEGKPLLAAFNNGKEWGKVASDPFTFGSLMWFLCEEQAIERGLTPDTFADRFDGQTTQAAGIALMEALTDFSQPSLAAELKAKQAEAIRLETERLKARINQLPIESLTSALKSQEQQELSPGGTPSAS